MSTSTADRATGQARTQRPPAAASAPTSWGHIVGLVLGVAALLALVMAAFAWPNVNTAPRSVPLVVAAPAAVVEQIRGQLGANAGEGAFEVTAVEDRAAAEQAVRDRAAYGALVLGPDGGEMLVASAASPAVAQALTQLAAGIPEQAGGPLPVTDLVPLPEDDPRGAGLASAVLPLVIGGLASGAVAARRVRGTVRALSTVLLIAAVGGPVLTVVLQTWLGALAGSFWANAGVIALGMAAVGAALLGLHRVFGVAGLGLGAVTMMLLGNPLSGVMTAPELLPGGWGLLGQWLPPGATGSALRSVAWFDGAGSGGAFLVLGIWLGAGVLLSMLPQRRPER